MTAMGFFFLTKPTNAHYSQNILPIFLLKSKLNFWTKNEDFEQCALKEEKSHYGICNVKQQGNHHLLWLGNGEGGFSRTLWQSTYNNHTHVVYTLFKRLTIFRKACR